MPRPSNGYRDKDNKRLPGVTTFTGIIWEPYKTKSMLDWAQELAIQEPPVYHEWDRDRKGLIGSISHERCIAYSVWRSNGKP